MSLPSQAATRYTVADVDVFTHVRSFRERLIQRSHLSRGAEIRSRCTCTSHGRMAAHRDNDGPALLRYHNKARASRFANYTCEITSDARVHFDRTYRSELGPTREIAEDTWHATPRSRVNRRESRFMAEPVYCNNVNAPLSYCKSL